jgi:hypothetical protein
MTEGMVHLCLERWKAKGNVAIDTHGSVERYKIAKIPPWFASLKMNNLTVVTGAEAKEMVKQMDDFYGEGDGVQKPTAVYKSFELLELTFEVIDPLKGGTGGNEKNKLVLPKRNGKPFIPVSWQKGWMRSNAPKFNMTGSIQHHIGMSPGEFIAEFDVGESEANVNAGGKGVGIMKYETVPEGTRFKTHWDFPMKGTPVQNSDDLNELLVMLADAPIRGMGANAYHDGGRILLVDMKKLPRPKFLDRANAKTVMVEEEEPATS